MFISNRRVVRMGLERVGQDVKIDEDVRIIGAARLSVGSHVRMDAQVLISCPGPRVQLGDHVHLATGSLLFCGGGVTIDSFVGISARASLFSETDDFTEGFLTGPTIPRRFRKVTTGRIRVGRHVVIGAGCVVLPNVTIGEGATIGALSLVTTDVEPFAVMAGTPARKVGTRNAARLRELERRFLRSLKK